MQALKESKPPVSAFWVVNDKVVGYEIDRSDGELVGHHIHHHCKFCDE